MCKVQNANAISGPLTWGFPSPTAFTGFAHALERRLSGDLQQGFAGVGIICHRFEPQIAQPAGRRTQVFRLTRNPVGKDGAPMALGRRRPRPPGNQPGHRGQGEFGESEGADLAERRLRRRPRACDWRAAASFRPAKATAMQPGGRSCPTIWTGKKTLFGKLRRRLLPGFALVQREDLLAERLAEIRVDQPDATALDALLDLSRLNIEPAGLNPAKPEETLLASPQAAGLAGAVADGLCRHFAPLRAGRGRKRPRRHHALPLRGKSVLPGRVGWSPSVG